MAGKNIVPIRPDPGMLLRPIDRAELAAGVPLLKNSQGALKPCEHNAFVLIGVAAQYSELHFDEFLSRQRLGSRDWSDGDDLALTLHLQSSYQAPGFTLAHARNGARAVAFSRRRDSLRGFIDALPRWDGVARIEHAFIDAWGADDTALMRVAARNFMIALIARALRPGSQVDFLFAFEGPQGSSKSRSMRELGGEMHAEIQAPIGTADFIREMMGVWIAELSELDSLRGREASTVKRVVSAVRDRFVQKYALHAESYPRRAIAVATTNEATYWQDPTGARRLVPIRCREIRIDLIAANRLQWFAEARTLFDAGATWWEFPDAIANEQEQRQQVDPWEDALRGYIEHGKGRRASDGSYVEPWPDGWISSAAIMRDWLELTPYQQGQASSTRLGRVMRRLGFCPARGRGKSRERGWIADTSGVPESEVSAEVSDDSTL